MGRWAGEPICAGDEPADILGEAIDKLDEVWLREWKRHVKRAEVLRMLEFVWPPEYGYPPTDQDEPPKK